MSVYVNVGGTSSQTCSCKVRFTPSSAKDKSGWVAHYIIETKKKIGKCSMIRKINGERNWSNCNNNATLGAHIRKKDGRSNNKQYIVPACASCNGFAPTNIDFRLKKGVSPVRALAANCHGTQTVQFSSSSGKSTTRNSQRKRTCKKFGCNTCPRGRNQYCSVHKEAKKKSCKKWGCQIVPRGRRLYCSKHRP